MGIRNGPISQIDIENEMLRLLDMLEEETEAFEKLAGDAAKKEALYKSNWAKEIKAFPTIMKIKTTPKKTLRNDFLNIMV